MEPIRLGGITLYPFGLLLAPLMAAALILMTRSMKKAGLREDTASRFAVLAVPLCFVLARLGFCLMVVDQIIGDGDPGMIFRVNEGGFLLWGAIAGGLLAALITGRQTGQAAGAVSDHTVVAACVLIAGGRLICGLVFRDQGIGFSLADWFDPEEEDAAYRFSLWALEDWSFFERFPFAVKNFYDEWCWAIFMPMSLWAGIMAVILSRSRSAVGGKTALFLLLYACGQIFLEGMLRGEVLHLPWLGFVRANQVLCAIALVWVVIHCLRRLPREAIGKEAIRCFAQVVPAVLVVVAMEFAAFEKKISLIETWPADVCHLLMGLACLWMGLAAGRVWKKAYSLQASGNLIQ